MIASKTLLLVLVSLVLKTSCEDAAKVDIDIKDNTNKEELNLDTPSGGIFVSCHLKWPNGTDTTDPEKENLGDISYIKNCKFAPKTNWNINLTGTYQLTLAYKIEKDDATKEEKLSKTFNINSIQPLSPETTTIFSGQSLTLLVRRPNQDFAEIESCKLVKLYSTDKESPGKIIDGSCQVDLNAVKTSDSGKYQVLAISKRKHRLKAFAEVKVIDEKELAKNNKISIQLSSNNKVIKSNIPIVKTLYCSLTNNHGTELYTSYGPCEYSPPQIKKSLEGEWKAKLLLEGKIEQFEQNIDVTVIEEKTFESDCKNSDSGVNMLCKCPSSGEKQCLFRGPSGQVLNAIAGVGNSKYVLYSEYDVLTKKQHCGLTLKKRGDDDQGTWTCNVVDICSRAIEVTKENGCISTDDKTEFTPTAPEKIYAQNGTNIQGLMCSINTDLDYCFFRTVRGEEILGKPHSERQGLCTMPYDFEVNTNHTGSWTCNLGVTTQHREYSKVFDVQVLTSLFQPTQDEFVYKDKNVELKCLNHLPFKKEVSMCRFIRPDGKVIKLDYEATLDHYTSTSILSEGICGLKLSSLKSEDKGRWRCSALVESSENAWLSKSFIVSSALILNASLRLVTPVVLFSIWCRW